MHQFECEQTSGGESRDHHLAAPAALANRRIRVQTQIAGSLTFVVAADAVGFQQRGHFGFEADRECVAGFFKSCAERVPAAVLFVLGDSQLFHPGIGFGNDLLCLFEFLLFQHSRDFLELFSQFAQLLPGFWWNARS
jgi:hypothetical protein